MRAPSPFALTATLVLAVVGGRLLVEPGLLGAPGGEVYAHAWVQWWHAQTLPGWPSSPGALLPAIGELPVIDPLPTALAALIGRLAGVEVGYNAWMLLGVVGAFLGGAFAARRCDGDPLVGGLALALAPAFLGSLASGLTEDAALGLAAVALALVGHPTRRGAVAAGLCLGLLCACGLVLAWAAAVAAIALGLCALLEDRGRWRGLLLSAGLAGVMAVPVALRHGERLSGRGHRGGAVTARFEPLWRLNPWHGVDLLSLVAPGSVEVGDALVRWHPGYLGLSALLLALCAGRSRWWLVLAGAVVAAPGSHLSFAGRPLGLDNPFAAVVDLLPLGGLINHHGRLLLIGAIALAVLAARGAARIGRWPAVGLLALDALLGSPIRLPLPVAESAPPQVVAEGLDTLSAGALLVVPAGGPGVHFQRPLLDQRWHGRPLLSSLNRPGLPPELGRTETGRWLGGLAYPDGPSAPETPRFPGEVGVLLVMEPYVAAVTAGLGPPQLSGIDAAAWDLRRRE